MHNFYLKIYKRKKINFHENFTLKKIDKPFYEFQNKQKKIIIFGNIFYLNLNNKKIKYSKPVFKKKLNYILQNKKENSFHKYFEGIFVILIITNHKISIINDYYKQFEIFYINSKDYFYVSNSIDNLNYFLLNKNKQIDFNPVSIINTLNVYGNFSLKKDTIFKQIKRIGMSEYLTFNSSYNLLVFKDKFKPLSVNKDIKVEEFQKVFLEAVKLRSSKSYNWIFMSSGWDSSSVLAALTQFVPKNKIKPIIAKVRFSKKYGFVNTFEVRKAKKICKHYGVKLLILNVDLTDKKYSSKLSLFAKFWRGLNLYSLQSFNQFCLSEYIQKKKYSHDDVVFNGDLSDTFQNFGFSQYAGILSHEDLNFREYFDKMCTYLFSGNFLIKSLNSNFFKDEIYNFILKLKNIKVNFKKKDNLINKKFKFLSPLYLSKNRLPFENIINSEIYKKSGLKLYFDELKNKYFNEVLKKLDKKNIYSCIIYLYQSFHAQSAQVRSMTSAPRVYNIKTATPFRDRDVVKYFEQMPEKFGRGLELKPTKFPLKKMLKNLNFPREVQIGPHSYLYDTDARWNAKEDIIYNSPASKVFKDIIKKIDLNKIFDSKFFNVNLIKKFTKDYLNNKRCLNKDLDFMFNLISLLVIIKIK